MNLRSDLRTMIRRWRPKLRGQGPKLAGCLKLDHVNKWIRIRIMMMMIIIIIAIIIIIIIIISIIIIIYHVQYILPSKVYVQYILPSIPYTPL
jgi:hypothetical protein